ncbi:MarR family transcriptional regulator [Vibrio astriarenae]|uniref:MarR family transcriptional regulator n=1 Tax=Vibrio astriarenae TaxID=1481923 RepID=A0A7Z2T2K4_9VIBR|nr:MarR family transcriptional regulator [Vibrio astriarenae]QIA63208.1 MarR family transcriptional regulator [Vibrio astriarenae]
MSQATTLEGLFGLAHAVKREMHHQIELLGLPITPMHMRVLKIISKTQDCTANHIVQFLSRDKAQVTRLLKPLLDEGLLDKAANPEDKRSAFLLVTEQGRTLVERIADVEQALISKMTSGVAENELQSYLKVANQMKKNLS